MTTAIERLAQFATTVPVASHPEAAIATAKRAFLDTIGCMLLGASSKVTEVAIRAAEGWGTGKAPVYGTGKRLPAPWAAMANGASAHAFDLDDYTLQANDHPSAVLVPALLAAVTDRPMSGQATGRALLDAYLVGLEAIFRLGEAVNMGHYNRGWHTTSTLGSIGASIAIARLMRLDARQTAAAVSLTTSLAAGYVSQFGTMGKPLHAGFSAKTGLLAAGLGRAGATAYAGALDGPVSFASLLVPDGAAAFDRAFAKLGAPWGTEEFGLGAKLYPSCGYTHRGIDGALELHERLGLSSANEIARATISLPDFHLAILPFGVPRDPTEALFSMPWCAAVALATGSCTSEDFTPAALARQDLLALTGRISVEARRPLRPEINVDPEDPDRVTVILQDGRRAETRVARWTGAPGREMSEAQLRAKFRDCCNRHDPDPTRAAARADAIEAAIDGLDHAPSLDALTASLAH
ncbi:MAG: MmgE/PrpD family protein [Pseudomonadota bacterium]